MVCAVTSTDTAHGFKLVTDYLTNPSRDSVVMRTRLLPLPGAAAASVAGLKVYARWDATIDNTGGRGAKNTGANDAQRGQSYSPQRSHYWRDASSQAFRSGFEQGYSQGYQQYGGYGNNSRYGRGSILGGIFGRP